MIQGFRVHSPPSSLPCLNYTESVTALIAPAATDAGAITWE